METSEERRAYAAFRKHLLKEGFMMLQKSVYVKLALNPTAGNVIMQNVKRHKPTFGLVQMLMLTEKQFSKMEYVVGAQVSTVLDSTDRMVIL